MKILITIPHNRITGVTTLNYALGKYLDRNGHEVTYSITKRETNNPTVQNKLQDVGKVFIGHDDVKHRKYDIAFLNGPTSMFYLKDADIKSKRWIAHGTMERGSYPESKLVDEILCVSEFTRQVMQKHNPKTPTRTIPNIIDSEQFFKDRSKNEYILLHNARSNYMTSMVKHMNELDFRMYTTGHHQPEDARWDIQQIIHRSKVVLAYGRCAYEAIFCNRPLVVFGPNGGDGAINTIKQFDKSFERNCSGWAVQSMLRPREIDTEELNRICNSARTNKALREYVIDKLDASKNYIKFIE